MTYLSSQRPSPINNVSKMPSFYYDAKIKRKSKPDWPDISKVHKKSVKSHKLTHCWTEGKIEKKKKKKITCTHVLFIILLSLSPALFPLKKKKNSTSFFLKKNA
jgi:hypothetical protein